MTVTYFPMVTLLLHQFRSLLTYFTQSHLNEVDPLTESQRRLDLMHNWSLITPLGIRYYD